MSSRPQRSSLTQPAVHQLLPSATQAPEAAREIQKAKHSCSLPTEDTRVGPVMWHAISPPLVPVLEQEVNELAAGVAYPSGASPTVHGFFLHDGGLSWAQLDSNRWSDAKAIVLPSGTTCSKLRVAYSSAGRLVLRI